MTPPAVTIDEAMHRAVETLEAVRNAGEQLHQAELTRVLAASELLPTASWRYTYFREFGTLNVPSDLSCGSLLEINRTGNFTFTQTLFDGPAFAALGASGPYIEASEDQVREAVPNADGRLKPGFFARVTAEVAARENAILVPETAVLATESGFVAYVVDGGGHARRRLLDPGLRTPGGRIEVRSGLAAGETLVVRGAGLLVDGAAVAIEPAGAEGEAGRAGTPAAGAAAEGGR